MDCVAYWFWLFCGCFSLVVFAILIVLVSAMYIDVVCGDELADVCDVFMIVYLLRLCLVVLFVFGC